MHINACIRVISMIDYNYILPCSSPVLSTTPTKDLVRSATDAVRTGFGHLFHSVQRTNYVSMHV